MICITSLYVNRKKKSLHYLKEARSVVSEWDSTNNQIEASTDES